MRAPRAGMTLVEVLLAVAILGVCLAGLMQGLSATMGVFHSSAFVSQAVNVLARGEEAHPAHFENDPVSELEVTPDGAILDGWTWARSCEEDEDEDGLWLVRVRVVQGRGGPGHELEVSRRLSLPAMEGSR